MHSDRLAAEFLDIILVHFFSEVILHHLERLPSFVLMSNSHVLF